MIIYGMVLRFPEILWSKCVTDIGSGSNITVAGEWSGNTRDAGAIIAQEMSYMDQYFNHEL